MNDDEPRLDRSRAGATGQPGATVDRAASLAEALDARALRHERVLEVLDLKAARALRATSRALRTVARRWAAAPDISVRSTFALELMERMGEAEAWLASDESSPWPASEPPADVAPPARAVVTEVCPVGEARVDLEAERPTPPEADQSFWQGLLGTIG